MAISDISKTLQSDADALPWRTCGACDALAKLPAEEAAELRSLLANPKVRYRELASALAEDEDSPGIDAPALSRHARGQCQAREKLR